MFRLSIGFECCSPLPRSPSLISASCSSGQWFAIDFLQTPRYRDALAELLALPLQRVSRRLTPLSNAPCWAHYQKPREFLTNRGVSCFGIPDQKPKIFTNIRLIHAHNLFQIDR